MHACIAFTHDVAIHVYITCAQWNYMIKDLEVHGNGLGMRLTQHGMTQYSVVWHETNDSPVFVTVHI